MKKAIMFMRNDVPKMEEKVGKEEGGSTRLRTDDV